jgi:hypothetical protein
MNLNSKTIAEIAQKSPTAEAFFSYVSKRERNARGGVSKLPDIKAQLIKEDFNPVPQELLSMFRELERVGVGVLQGDTFKWSVPIKQVGKVLKSDKVVSSIPKSKRTLAVYFDTQREIEMSFSSGLTREEAKLAMEKLLQQCDE